MASAMSGPGGCGIKSTAGRQDMPTPYGSTGEHQHPHRGKYAAPSHVSPPLHGAATVAADMVMKSRPHAGSKNVAALCTLLG
jgi:hypothetical protein